MKKSFGKPILHLALALLALGVPAPSAAAATAPTPPTTRSLGGGGWCWFADPRAINHRGAHNRTYIGWIDRDGGIRVASYDHATRLRTTIVLHWGLSRDDHNNPALHMLPDGRLIVFYSRHGGSKMYYRVSRRPEEVTAWDSERTIPTNTVPEGGGRSHYTYPNPVQLSEEADRLWLFWRGGTSWPTYSTSPDDGATWSQARNWISYPGNRPYVKYASDAKSTIHFAFNQGHPATLNTNIYYARYRDGAIYGADGRRIKSTDDLPLTVEEADKVYDTGSKAWIHDIAYDSLGRPVIVFAVINEAGNHHYRYARWNGKQWRHHTVTSAGRSIADGGAEPFYSGGITLDHEHPSVVYVSRPADGKFEVLRMQTPDGGETWTSQGITSGSPSENVRPVSPRGLRSFGDDLSVLWMRGDYRHYVDYRTDLTARLLNGGNLPPEAAANASPRGGTAPLSVSFDGRVARDPDGRVAMWSWYFGDGTSARGPQVSHVYSTPGRYFARVVVTDDLGDKDVYVVQVNVRG